MRLIKSVLLILSFSIVFLACSRPDDVVLNQVPVANAGPSQTITPPTTLNLTGTGTDADGQIVAYLWSQVAGPVPAIFANAGAASTSVSGTVAGNYIFQLMVTDNDGATGVDTVSVKINPAPDQTATFQPS